MIYNIELNNFKSHKNTIAEFKNLTVLCGANGVGKSSLIQILLLLREAFIKDRSFEILDLKSNPVKIGTANDAIYEFGDYEGFEVKINESRFIFETFSEDEKEKSFIKLNKKKTPVISLSGFAEKSLFNEDFQYIGAARTGPQESYPKDSKVVDVYKQISVNEGKAEFFLHFLDTYRDKDVLEKICLIDEKGNLYNDLYAQVILWEKYIFNGANAEVQDLGKIGYQLRYYFENNFIATKKTKSFEAKNVGFGLTYTLPILVAILSAKKNSLIVIENPEAHLHPSGVARLTELICLASQAGIQIVLETHSDHVINGILVQCKKYEKNNDFGIWKDNISIYQFERDEKEHCSIATKIEIEKNGSIRFAPEGFFDQNSIDTDFLYDL